MHADTLLCMECGGLIPAPVSPALPIPPDGAAEGDLR